MRRWLRRGITLFLLALWLLIMAFPLVAVVLATQGQIQVGDVPGNHVRLFLVQERGARGVGIEWTRPVQEPPGCAQTSLAYLMWEGEGQSVTYCRCFDENGLLVENRPGACRVPS
ncbi:MAG: hypothetical protein R3272_10420 [Candidatus Promineifilaceae bacterium]|nr:hypothetical protein [Candidatus Promineifilaceae bacterium]